MSLNYARYQIEVQGVAPLLQHNGDLASKMNPIARKMAEINSKRKKVDADYIQLGTLEFRGGLYLDAEGKITLPPVMLESWLVEGAKMHKEGQIALAGMFVEQNVEFSFAGPQTIEEREKDPTCRLTARVRVQRNTVERVRPMFDGWNLKFDVSVIEQTVPESMLKRWATSAANFKGLGDWRPRYGRGEVVSVKKTG